MFDLLLKQLESLDRAEIQVEATGEYPVKKKTKVADVARWQNNGTDTITPARFVETAERKARNWDTPVWKGVEAYLFGGAGLTRVSYSRSFGANFYLVAAAKKIAADIGKAVNRIRTGRLKRSMEGKFVK